MGNLREGYYLVMRPNDIVRMGSHWELIDGFFEPRRFAVIEGKQRLVPSTSLNSGFALPETTLEKYVIRLPKRRSEPLDDRNVGVNGRRFVLS